MKKSAPELNRSMTAGQMEMISLGGAIGVGLFMGSTSTIKWTGPSVILAYAFVCLILYIVMRALGEMIYINPGTGSFADYATEYVHPVAGYLAKWANVFEYIVVGMSEVVAATEYLKYWWNEICDGVPFIWQRLGSGYGYNGTTILRDGNVVFKDIYDQLMIDEYPPQA